MKISKRWIPAILASAIIAATVVAVPLQASAVDLPDLTAKQVMLLMEKPVVAFSGTVMKTTDLGLPALEMSSMMSEDMVKDMEEKMPEGFEEFVPQILESNALTQAIELIAGTHEMRIYASEAGVRVQILDAMSERDLIVNESEFWIYDARNATAIRGEVPELDQAKISEFSTQAQDKLDDWARDIQLDISNPDAVAEYLLAQAGETSEISVGKDHMIAGRTAYQLIAQPKAENSLVDSIVVSIDSETGMALDLKVYSVEQEAPAVSIGFESITFATPDASLFSFTPPAGTTVEQMEVPAELEQLKELYEANVPTEAEAEAMKAELEAKYAEIEKPLMIGEGWDSVLYLAQTPEQLPMDMMENELFADLLKVVDGGRVFSTPLMNVLITDSGEVYAGSVTIKHLLEVAAR